MTTTFNIFLVSQTSGEISDGLSSFADDSESDTSNEYSKSRCNIYKINLINDIKAIKILHAMSFAFFVVFIYKNTLKNVINNTKKIV